MFRSINSKFYLIAILLIGSFCYGYFLLAYFQHQQNQSSSLAQEAILLEHDISTLTELFYEARFWEKVTFTQKSPEADMHFISRVEKIRKLLEEMIHSNLDEETQVSLTQIRRNVGRYEAEISKLIQFRTTQSLHATRMYTNYRSMVSVILSSGDPELLKPLFNLTHFLISYRSARDLPTYQALKLVTNSLETKIHSLGDADARMIDYLQSFKLLLDENYAMELRISSINSTIEEINKDLNDHFSEISTRSGNRLKSSLHESDDIRKELQLLFLVSTAFGILFLLLILRIISRNIILPIRSIAHVMQKVKGGDIGARFSSKYQSRDEIIQFGFSFNEMLATLETNNRQLIEYQKELEQKIKELSEREAERQRLTAQLQRIEKMEAIGTLAGGVAHDLNNILSGIVSYPELLLLELPQDSPYRKTIKTIQESGQKAAAIVQDLLTLARRGVAVTEVTNFNRLIEEYLNSPEHSKLIAKYPNIVIKVDLHEELFNISGSPIHLSKTIMNLVSNAAESIHGSGNITIHTENRYISEPVMGYDDVKKGDYAVLTVTDTGSGIAASDLERIFEPFFTKKVMGTSGTGLGLAVVWGTVKDHNGYIDVKSMEGQGTTFTLYFPVTRDDLDTIKTSPPLHSYLGNGESILVVDDIESQREIAANMLERLGYNVITAASGEDAISMLRESSVDLVMLDMLMPPGIDGLETYKRILEFSPEQRAIIASGYSETDRVKEAQKLGAAMYIKKPYSLETIGLAIQAALKKSGKASR